MESDRLSLIRIIKIYTGNFEGLEESWNNLIEKVPIDLLKQLSVAVQEFFKYKSFMKKVSPLQIATEKGSLELCRFIIGVVQGSNPTKSNGVTKLKRAGSFVRMRTKFRKVLNGNTALQEEVNHGPLKMNDLISKDLPGVNILRKEHPFVMGIFGVLLGRILGFSGKTTKF